jgi:hypothetical protein
MKSNLKSERELKEEYLSWVESVKIRRMAYDSAKYYLKQRTEELRISKKIFNATYNDWKKARKEVEVTKRRWKTYPYKLRQWSKNNFGKVMNFIEKNERTI